MGPKEEIADYLDQIGKAMQKIDEYDITATEDKDLEEAKIGISEIRELAEGEEFRYVRFDAYVLWNFLDDLWGNIAMVPSTYINDTDIIDLLEHIGDELETMGQLYREGSRSKFNERLVHVFDNYVETISSINLNIKESKTGVNNQ